ncbi:MAG: hypothetical protein M3454_03690 [Actinomycetota bacterium]|nr:hypothetical protein [Actinomycetota bacterium]
MTTLAQTTMKVAENSALGLALRLERHAMVSWAGLETQFLHGGSTLSEARTWSLATGS